METKYRGTKERAAELRALLKKRHGWTGRQVSVRTDSYSMGSALRVTVKDPTVPISVVEELAHEHESIRRCEYSGEILSGGNRYVTVGYSTEAEKAMAAPYLEASTKALAALEENRKTPDRRNVLEPVEGTPYLAGLEGNGWGVMLWESEGEYPGVIRHTCGAEGLAQAVAYALMASEVAS